MQWIAYIAFIYQSMLLYLFLWGHLGYFSLFFFHYYFLFVLLGLLQRFLVLVFGIEVKVFSFELF